MDQQTSNNFKVNSRTLCVQNVDNIENAIPVKFTKTSTTNDGTHMYYVCDSVSDAQELFDLLKNHNSKPKVVQCTYSLFMKYQGSEQSPNCTDLLRTFMSGYSGMNFTYTRIDPNGFTGKVCVDKYEDYNTLKNLSTGDFRFFHFNPKKVFRPEQNRPRTNNNSYQRPSNNSNGYNRSRNNNNNNNNRRQNPQNVSNI